jgi:hypothetical protein
LSYILVSAKELNHDWLAHVVPLVQHIVAHKGSRQLFELNKDLAQRGLLDGRSLVQVLQSREYKGHYLAKLPKFAEQLILNLLILFLILQ